jgi:hypothetical protein
MDSMLLSNWGTATGNLSWGVQRVFLETLHAVKDGDIHLVHGSDYRDGKPCLVNAVASMLTTGGGAGIPSAHFGPVVSLFDQINDALLREGVNTDGYVSPLAAEILIRNFGPLKPEPAPETLAAISHGANYVEPSDEELASDWLKAMEAPSREELETATDPISQFAKEYLDSYKQ